MRPAGLSAELADHFDEVYRNANGEASRVPWAECRPNPLLVEWLNVEAPRLVRPGSRAAVVGCGLGDDVVELAHRGYDVVGFDISPTAIKWAARRHPDLNERFAVADVLNLPPRLQRRFDLVVEVNTICSLDAGVRRQATAGIAGMLAPRGVVVVVSRGREPERPVEECVGPPARTGNELVDLMLGAGLCVARAEGGVDEHCERHEDPPLRTLCGAFARA